MDKRTFLKSTALMGLGGVSALVSLAGALNRTSILETDMTQDNDDFWKKVRQQYRLKDDYINLENGYYCILPDEILERYLQHIREVNLQGAFYMRTAQAENKQRMVAELASLAGCAANELIITRNTTESLDMIISGIDWKPGDEAVMATHDYPAMLDMFRQVEQRYGMTNKVVALPLHPGSDEEIVDIYARAITPKTKLLMVCHMINITGQILPVRKICDMAHGKNVPVLVDGAHAFAHIQFSIPDLHCDFYGCSLHKWLSVPLGAGLLYMSKEHIPHIWPLLGESGRQPDDIRRLNHTGTHPPATDLAILDAINFYKHIGGARKEQRLRYLQQYWTSRVRHMPHIVLNTPDDPARSCGIANVGIKNMDPAAMAKLLLEKHKIYTVAINNAGVAGCRITPNVYTTTGELDVLVAALASME